MALKNSVYVASVIQGLFQNIRRLLPACDVKSVSLTDDGRLSQQALQEVPEAEILVADPPVACQILYADLPKLKWFHSTWAGVETIVSRIDHSKPLPSFCMTRNGQGFGNLMAEFVVCHTIAFERDLRTLYIQNDAREWKQISNFRSLPNLVMGIMGVGQIGREVARACKMMGMTVWALSRSAQLSESCQYVDHVVPNANLPAFLSGCDYICNILPSTPHTRDLLSGDVLKACKEKGSVFINIGRGDVIDEESLLRAIREKWLRGAILDVFKEEPLPASSELWSLPNVTITPHCSGPSFSSQVADCFVKNYNLYANGEKMHFVVDWKKGY